MLRVSPADALKLSFICLFHEYPVPVIVFEPIPPVRLIVGVFPACAICSEISASLIESAAFFISGRVIKASEITDEAERGAIVTSAFTDSGSATSKGASYSSLKRSFIFSRQSSNCAFASTTLYSSAAS